MQRSFLKHVALLALLVLTAAPGFAQSAPPSEVNRRAAILRGEYGRYRANNDLLSYHLDIRVDPEKKFLSGKNRIRFRMLSDDRRIHLDLQNKLKHRAV